MTLDLTHACPLVYLERYIYLLPATALQISFLHLLHLLLLLLLLLLLFLQVFLSLSSLVAAAVFLLLPSLCCCRCALQSKAISRRRRSLPSVLCCGLVPVYALPPSAAIFGFSRLMCFSDFCNALTSPSPPLVFVAVFRHTPEQTARCASTHTVQFCDPINGVEAPCIISEWTPSPVNPALEGTAAPVCKSSQPSLSG